MKYLILLSIFVGLQSALAETPAVYVVDMQRIVDESVVGKAARSNFEVEVKKSQLKIQTAAKEVEDLKEKLKKQATLLSPDAVQVQQDLIEKKARLVERLVQDQREEMGRKNNAEVGKIMADIGLEIKSLAKERGYNFVVEKDPRLVVYANDSFDITADVIKSLDRKKLGS